MVLTLVPLLISKTVIKHRMFVFRFAFLLIPASIIVPRAMGQNISFIDSNFEAALIEDGVDGGDGVITEAEAAAITSLDVRSEGITDMSEIQYFTLPGCKWFE